MQCFIYSPSHPGGCNERENRDIEQMIRTDSQITRIFNSEMQRKSAE